MQEFQSIPGLAGRLFGGAGPSDLRRAQAASHQGPPGARCGGAAQPEAVKCPRCESTNTKFCYYNNYNLSQPRHFCKSCRRYWTKGGVLRNVPVGGGCRKAKRSSASSPSSSAAASSAPSSPPSTDAKNPRRASASSPRSNSGSGSGSPTASASGTTTAAPAAPSLNGSIAGVTTTTTNPFSEVAPPAPIFADQAAALASLFTPPPPPPLPLFSFTATLQQHPMDEAAAAGAASSSSAADMTPFTLLDTAGMFELGDASAVAYWNAGSCWTDVPDPSVYLP